MAKRKSKKKKSFITAHIYGILNVKDQEVLKVSLDKNEIEMEFALTDNDNVHQFESVVALML